jgi:hypothetical protein
MAMAAIQPPAIVPPVAPPAIVPPVAPPVFTVYDAMVACGVKDDAIFDGNTAELHASPPIYSETTSPPPWTRE